MLFYSNQKKSLNYEKYLNELRSRIQKAAIKPIDIDDLAIQPDNQKIPDDNDRDSLSIQSTTTGIFIFTFIYVFILC